jgi:hypothetical protein
MRHRRPISIAASAATLLLLAVALLFASRAPSLHEPAPAGSTVIDAPPTALAATAAATASSPPSAPQASVASTLPPDTEWWTISLADHLRALELAALSGDMFAARVLGSRLASCLGAIRDPQGERLRRTYGAHQTRQKEWHDREVAKHADCLAVGEAAVLRYHEWLELAARSGNVHAMSAYAEWALKAFEGNAEMLANLDEVIRRRDLARHWAQQALSQGDVNAINVMTDAYFGDGGLYPRDMTRGAAHELLRVMASRHRQQDTAGFDRAWNAADYRWDGLGLTPQQQQEAIALAREMFDAWFRHAPRG